MRKIKSELDRIAVRPDQYPKEPLSEIAFAGRSNVGKSSFINSMINNKNLARTSGKPGKTRTINFYKINDKFRFVDLPGYGYAKVSKDEREKWGHIIEEYLTTRDNLKEVILVIDIRHKPSKDDVIMYDWIKHYGYGKLIVATKADKISKNAIVKHIKMIQDELGVEDREDIIPYSSENKMNSRLLWGKIGELVK